MLAFLYLAFVFIGSHIMKAVFGSQLPPKNEKKGFLMTAALVSLQTQIESVCLRV